MSERRLRPSVPREQAVPSVDPPSPEAVAFIRFCHRRRHVGWPELYDEMCAVAARREFRGWGHEELAARDLAFSLREMPRLAGWVRAVLATDADGTPQPNGESPQDDEARRVSTTQAAHALSA